MKLTFKDLKQQKFTLEAEPSETIGQVKEKISEAKGWDVPLQKLIYSGKILQDANTVESYNIEEKGFIVCMMGKPKPNPAASSSSAKPPSTPAPATAQTPVAPPAPAPASNTTSNAPATPTPAGANASAGTADREAFNDPSALALGAQREAAIANMESMGFPRADIDRAMRAAFFNPDRAVEYLLNGIPENVQAEQRQGGGGGSGGGANPAAAAANPASPTPATGTGATPAAEGDDGSEQPINLFEAAAQAGRGGSGGGGRSARATGGGSGGDAAGGPNIGALSEAMGAAAAANTQPGGENSRLDFLRTNAQFQQLRQVVQGQPRMLEPILQQLAAGNPQLAALIGQHPDQFLALLSEDADGDAPLPPGAQEISVTEEERDAIERLCSLGFERDEVIQAYFACDKNEDLAANFLFDQPHEGEGGP